VKNPAVCQGAGKAVQKSALIYIGNFPAFFEPPTGDCLQDVHNFLSHLADGSIHCPFGTAMESRYFAAFVAIDGKQDIAFLLDGRATFNDAQGLFQPFFDQVLILQGFHSYRSFPVNEWVVQASFLHVIALLMIFTDSLFAAVLKHIKYLFGNSDSYFLTMVIYYRNVIHKNTSHFSFDCPSI